MEGMVNMMSLVKATGNGMSNLVSSMRAVQRKDAGQAYRKHHDYFQPKTPSLNELEELLLGNKEKEKDTPELSAAIREFQEMEKQTIMDIKGPGTPIQSIGGPTPEKTIELLEKVRSQALAEMPATPQHLLVAANATSKIRQEEAQLTLNEMANRQIELETKRQKEMEAEVFNRSMQVDFQTPKVLEEDLQSLQTKRLKEQAIAKYSYQVHLRKYGFSDQQPSFFQIA